jgi:hypothetical protein
VSAASGRLFLSIGVKEFPFGFKLSSRMSAGMASEPLFDRDKGALRDRAGVVVPWRAGPAYFSAQL